MSHKIACYRIERIGFLGPFLRLLQNFLSGRSELVTLGAVKSCALSLKAGAPPGSVLSPLIVYMYVNNTFKAISFGEMYQYADDTVFLS